MFDKTKANVILLSDLTDVISMPKTLGPYKVAYTLRQAGFEVAVIHHLSIFTVDEIETILANLINKNTVMIGVNNFFYASVEDIDPNPNCGINLDESEPGTILPHGRRYNKRIKQIIKQANPDCRLMLGGPSATDAAHNKDFDFVVVGYAENSIINLARHLTDLSTKLEKSYRSIHGFTVVNDSKAEGYDFSQSHMCYQDHDAVLPGETLVIEIGRGCIFKCSFCSYPLNGKKKLDFIRHRDLILQEMLDNYHKHGVTRYIFCDDTVNDSVEKCEMIYDISQKLPFELEWWGYIRLDLLAAHPHTIDLLFGSGLRSAFFGIETLNPRTGAAIGKGGSRERLIQTLRQIKDRWGDQVNLHGSFIYGLPYEDLESMAKTTEFLFSADNPLDSWSARALHIRSDITNLASNGFVSDLDRNYAKYGYRQLGSTTNRLGVYTNARHPDQMIWENDHCDFLTVLEMVEQITHQGREQSRSKLSGNYAFNVMGMGVDSTQVFNRYQHEIDWAAIDAKKLDRAQQYRDLLCDRLGIDRVENLLDGYRDFSDYLRRRQLTTKDV